MYLEKFREGNTQTKIEDAARANTKLIRNYETFGQNAAYTLIEEEEAVLREDEDEVRDLCRREEERAAPRVELGVCHRVREPQCHHEHAANPEACT